MTRTFDYGYTKVRDLYAVGERRRKSGKATISAITVEGEKAVPTKRFWKSFFVRFGISDNVFRYFEPTEVFQRISERAPDDLLRYCLERDHERPPRLLAVSHPNRAVIRYAEVLDLASRHGGHDPKYADGIVTTTHTPRSGDQPFQIGGDHFHHRFVLETPVDGFSHPKIYLSLLRQICTNGMVGYTRAFRSDVSLGKDIAHCIGRALETYDNGEGYAALAAAVRECPIVLGFGSGMPAAVQVADQGQGAEGRDERHADARLLSHDGEPERTLRPGEPGRAEQQTPAHPAGTVSRLPPAELCQRDCHAPLDGRGCPHDAGLHRQPDFRRVRHGGHGGNGHRIRRFLRAEPDCGTACVGELSRDAPCVRCRTG